MLPVFGEFCREPLSEGSAPLSIFNTARSVPGSRPAKPGESVAIYCTGLGNVTNAPDPGAPALSNPLSHTLGTPVVTLGGAKVSTTFSGLAPGFVGLYQVNMQIPAGVAGGSAVPLVLMIGGVSSNTATIAVQ